MNQVVYRMNLPVGVICSPTVCRDYDAVWIKINSLLFPLARLPGTNAQNPTDAYTA
jgi:hypothetical protein